ncbi:MAG TPA: choice-of-anchor D domain-containing protein, partial [Myxococcaceae bacterium]|nr:choice-of-anchor D domain-containing protein [Myxococcaceae bacterium]
MRRAWVLGVVVGVGLALGCSGTGGGTGGDGGGTLPDGGTPPDGGCTGPACNPDGGVATPLTATPDRIVIGTTPGAAKSAQLTLQNTSASTVSLQSLNVSGNGAGAFSVSGATAPMDLASGQSVTLTVTFNGAAGVSQASLAAATAAGTTTVPLGGLAIPAGTEPSLQWIFDVHNIPVNAGNPDPSKKDLPASPIAGDEIALQSFQKAGDGPVTLQLLGSYGPTFEPVSIDGWYVSGNAASRTELFRIAQANAFALDPAIENGGTSFDPGSSAFGFWSEWPFWETPNQGIGQYFVYQEDALNTWDSFKHHVRVYPYKNPDGSLDPHAYIVAFEEAPVSVGPDYNDIVYVVRNAVPAGSGGGGALQFLNEDGLPGNDRMVFSVITTIAPCWGPLSVKDTGTVKVQNLSGGTVTVSAIAATDAFTATPATGLPAALAPGASLEVAVKFVATDGRVHNGTLTVDSDDASAPSRTM